MSKAHQEEIIAMLGVIASLLAFGFGYGVWGSIFAAKAGLDALCALKSAWNEAVVEQLRAQAATKTIAEKDATA